MIKLVPIYSVCEMLKETINPQEYVEKQFIHYSLPAFDRGSPKLEYGTEIQSTKLIINRPCILFSRLNPRIRRVWDLSNLTSDNTAICSTEFVPFIVKDNTILESRYLYWFFHSEKFLTFARSGVQAATKSRERVNKESLFKVEIPLPPLEEQRRIAAILDKADDIRRKRKRAIALTEELLRSTFLDMFGDPVTNPKGWDVKTLGSLCKVRRGASPRPISEYLGGSIPWIKIGDATESDDIYIYKTAEAVTEEGSKKSLYLKPESLIFANCGVSLGFARIIKIGGCIHDGWLAFSEISDSLNKIYFLKLLNSVTNYFRQIAPSGTQANLNTGIMKYFCIPLPPIQLQCKFAHIAEELTLSKQRQSEALKTSDKLFNSLLQKAFKGEL